MAKKFINQTHIEGYLYDHKLEQRISGPDSKRPNTPYIAGTISIATDDELLNVVQVHYTYVTETRPNGQPNNKYFVLEGILSGKFGTVMQNGIENAAKVRVDSAIGLREWYDSQNANTLISNKCNEDGFIHITQELDLPKNRATFKTDMIITSATRMEENEERGLPERVILKGCVFDFKNALLPVEFTVLNPMAMDYFESCNPSTSAPMFTLVKGNQVSKVLIKKIEETSAWGEISVREVKSSQKDFVVTWALPEAYEWDSSETILASELTEMMGARELYLANLKQRAENNNNNSNGARTSPTYKF